VGCWGVDVVDPGVRCGCVGVRCKFKKHDFLFFVVCVIVLEFRIFYLKRFEYVSDC